MAALLAKIWSAAGAGSRSEQTMTDKVSVIMPAYNAERTIVPAAQSVIDQTHADWELVVISDDGVDYEAVLGRAGLADRRFRFLSSGQVRGGASRARNIALDAVDAPYAAILDSDDRFKPEKLARSVAGLRHAPIVTTALDVMGEDFAHLRFVADGPDRLLSAGEHKWVNISMDSMVVWDRARCDARYEPGLPNLTDLDFLMKLYRTASHSYHLGTPLHDYVKMKVSMSNGPGVTERMIGVKTLLLERLARGDYPMADPDAARGISAFLTISLDAERSYGERIAREPDLLFEDNLEPMLARARMQQQQQQ